MARLACLLLSVHAAFEMLSHLWAPILPPRPRRLRGVRRQRQSSDEDPAPEVLPNISRLAGGHLIEWCDGRVSALRRRNRMANAVADGMAHPMALRLSNIGSEGSPQRCNRGLMGLLQECGVNGLIDTLPTNDRAVLPSRYIALLHKHYNRDFGRLLGA
eukprot:5686578-Pyramimonas_sp.AAC.1